MEPKRLKQGKQLESKKGVNSFSIEPLDFSDLSKIKGGSETPKEGGCFGFGCSCGGKELDKAY
ncbi:hypothetical protein [Proteiniphilum sp. X52]|uniref:hypothetical protein n=1 Tax=Proteiniphilum sp. X52 TaxID=2382159 RepID=UPI000F09E3A3|nr:hypothetical protein [Proteiniphilum sp. X52]RNC63421.1 hypothetical protein D7D25_16655 [Proteiniphilum sp. X52]